MPSFLVRKIEPARLCFLIFSAVLSAAICPADATDGGILIDERKTGPAVLDMVEIDTVWAGHPVNFAMQASGDRQFFAYFDAERRMVLATRRTGETHVERFYPQTGHDRPPRPGSPPSTRLGWDSHNYLTMAIDSEGHLHVSGNMHNNALTYFRTTKPRDLASLEHVPQMTGEQEDKTTYPAFRDSADGDLIFTYRHGSSGSGNQISNIYCTESRTWSRLVDEPLTDGEGERNAYLNGPVRGPDGWYHVTWVWRDTPCCSTNHHLSYARSPDLRQWFTAAGEPLRLPLTLGTEGVSVDPIPPRGGIINGTGNIGFDHDGKVVITFHKFDGEGNTQAYVARWSEEWQIKPVTNWDYRWFFEGGGSIVFEIRLGTVEPRSDGYLQLDYSHVHHGSGTWLLNEDLDIVGRVIKHASVPAELRNPTGNSPGMKVHFLWGPSGTTGDGTPFRYLLRWETLPQNRDRPHEGPLPDPSPLRLYKIGSLATPPIPPELPPQPGTDTQAGKQPVKDALVSSVRGVVRLPGIHVHSLLPSQEGQIYVAPPPQ